MKKISNILMLLVSFSFPLIAQQLDHFQGDIIVQVRPGTQVEDLVRTFRTYNGVTTNIEVGQEVSAPMRIWLLHFDFARIHEHHFLHAISQSRLVEVAQFNHILSFRQTIPDDPNFNQQWMWLNTGQTGGTPDADLDLDLAWELTTGGETATGDEIVVAVIEGCNRNHPDLKDNIWYNEAEIPFNGLDDDNNGYVDDYNGWNVNTNNDNINAEGHGTTVSGTIGAVGNNNFLVTGVNWKVKIMHVDFNGVSEANSLAAYTYPWVMRKKYNESQGQEGAFVVATNASWGLDFGDPASAPLWCAIYDSLGQEGILSCGATANLNINIDEEGDLPTACPSEYMIAVTATNHQDIRTFSGYGTEHIDVGAPGENIIQISLNGGPSNSSGTSFASPTVAGLIGLLYATPCSTLGPLALSNPSQAALLVRNAIFAGVDQNPSLLAEVKYGGRVNAFNSMQYLLENCGPCPAPFGFELMWVDDVSAGLDWVSTDSTLQTNLRWRIQGEPNWEEIQAVHPPFILDSLEACTFYEVQVEDICADTTSGYTFSLSFQTDGCCEAPGNVAVGNITVESAEVSWDFVLVANSYNLLLTFEGGEELITGITGTSTLLTLEPCTAYGVQLQTVCDTGVTDYGPIVEFKTFGCGTCTDAAYCPSSAAGNGLEWIENVTLNTLNNTSGLDNGYGDYTGMATDLLTYNVYPVSLTPGYSNIPFNEYFTVWIDLNHDGDFDDPDEEVFDPGSVTQETVDGHVIIPGSATPGLTRMRVVMRFNVKPMPCDPVFSFGEVEDYCVNIQEGIPPDCLVPSGLTISNVGFTGADFFWESVPDAHAYDVRIKPTAFSNWVSIYTEDLTFTASSLIACTEYEWQVRSRCVGTFSEWSESFLFTTECLPPCDEIPGGLDTTGVSENGATLIWNSILAAESYQVRYRPDIDPVWQISNVTEAELVLTGLENCTEYVYAVQAICAGDQTSGFSDIRSFTTDCVQDVVIKNEKGTIITLWPNPVDREIYLDMVLSSPSEIDVTWFDAKGQLFESNFFRGFTGENRFRLLTQAESLPSGIYFVRIRTAGGIAFRRVVVK